MSGIWTVICRIWSENMGDGQFSLSIFRTSTFDVRIMDSFLCPCSGHRPGHILDITEGRAMELDPANLTVIGLSTFQVESEPVLSGVFGINFLHSRNVSSDKRGGSLEYHINRAIFDPSLAPPCLLLCWNLTLVHFRKYFDPHGNYLNTPFINFQNVLPLPPHLFDTSKSKEC